MSNWKLSMGAAFDRMPYPVFLMKDNLIAYSNPAAVRLTGLTAGSAAPESFSALVPDCAASLRLGKRNWSALSWLAEGKLMIQLTPLDETTLLPDRRISHLVRQLRIPLTALLYASEKVEQSLSSELREDLELPVARAKKAQLRLMRLARTLELSALSDGEYPYDAHFQTVDLSGLFGHIGRLLETPVAEAGRNFSYENHTRNQCIWCDDQLIQILIFHLISNAIRATAPGGHIKLLAERKGEMALISVEDDGRGMTSEQLATLFSPSEGGETMTDPDQGLGLGITVCRKIAQLHNGSIMLVNREKQGVRATVSLKLEDPGASLVLNSPRRIDSSNGMALVLRELSDVLPERCFRSEA